MLVCKVLGVLLALLATAVWSAAAADLAEPLATIGFHEGTKRTAACKGGVLKGLEVKFVTDNWAFAEPFIGAVRFLCTSGEVDLQYTGTIKDAYFFGRDNITLVRTATCEGDLGMGGIKWRHAGIKNPDGAEARIAGFTILCNRAGNAPQEIILEHKDGLASTFDREFNCKKVAAYAGLATPRISKAIMWYNLKSWAGFEPIECA